MPKLCWWRWRDAKAADARAGFIVQPLYTVFIDPKPWNGSVRICWNCLANLNYINMFKPKIIQKWKLLWFSHSCIIPKPWDFISSVNKKEMFSGMLLSIRWKQNRGCQAQRKDDNNSHSCAIQLSEIDYHLRCFSLMTFFWSSEISVEDFQSWWVKTDCVRSDVSETKRHYSFNSDLPNVNALG